MRSVALALVAVLATAAHAQQKVKPVDVPHLASAGAKPTPEQKAVPAKPSLDALSPLEKDDLEILGLRSELSRTQNELTQAKLAEANAAKVTAIEAAHPGFKWHYPATPHDTAGLVPVESAEPKK